MPERRASLVAVLCLVAGCTIGTPRASVVPEITPRPTPLPTVRPSSSAEATSTPVPTPTPTPDPTLIDLEAVSCNGGVLLDWSASTNPDFHHYSALRSPDREIAPDYPPVAPAVDWGDTYTTDRFVTTAVDASILPSDDVVVLPRDGVRRRRARDRRLLRPRRPTAGARRPGEPRGRAPAPTA